MLSRALAPIRNKLSLIVTRAVVTRVNDALKCQSLQVSIRADELRDGTERFEDYGMTSHPFEGAEAIALAVGGNRSHTVAIAVQDRRYRPKNMSEGDVCLYNDNGERVYLESSTDLVHLGAKSAAEFVALAAKTDARIAALQAAHDGHTHATTATVGPSGVPGTIAPPTPVGAQASVAATKVKAT